MERPALVIGVSSLACVISVAACLAATRIGTPGRDRLVGTERADELAGLAGPDVLIGGRGNDVLIGGAGPDALHGGAGRDGFNMRNGAEITAPGSDRIAARDGTPDEINCGGGDDIAIVDAKEDGVYNCERVIEP
jgi:Ca2+-binding RTX toxin-like protein